VEEKDAEKNTEDWGKKSESGEPAHRVFVDELEPNQVGDKGDDDRLIEQRGDDIKVNLVDPPRLKYDAQDEQDGDREKKLIKKGVYGFHPLCHKPLDVKRCGSPQDGSGDLQNISQEHSGFGRFGSAAKDDEDASKSQGEAQAFWNGQPIPFEKKMGPDGHNKGAQIDKEHRTGGIGIEQAEVNAGELRSEQKTHHHPVKEHPIRVE
jgi:hypothetical protein